MADASSPTRPICTHPQCRCSVGAAGEFCSEHCRRAHNESWSEQGCACGHADCARPETPLPGESPDAGL